jgi:hypothetical protein
VPLPLLRHVQTHRYSDLSFSPTDGGDQNQDQGHNGRKKSLRRVLSEWHADGDGDADDDGTAGAVLRDNKREEGALYGILGVVLALILVNGKVLGDGECRHSSFPHVLEPLCPCLTYMRVIPPPHTRADQLVSYLKRLSLTPSTTLPLSLASPHPDSITLSSFLSTLVKQQYLERGSSAHLGAATQGGTKSQARTQTQRATQKGKDAGAEAGDPAIEWRWGPRSEVEFGEVGVAKFVHQVFTDPSSLPRGAQSQTQTQTQGGKGGGDRFLAEVARAAGVKKLAGTERNKGGGADGEEEEEGGEEESE